MKLVLLPQLKKFFAANRAGFNDIMQLHGEKYRELENRCTKRILLGEEAYFIKQHKGVGWGEIWKNLFQLRLPVLSAKNEWRAIFRLHELNIPTTPIVAYGKKGLNPATMQSFLMTKELTHVISLEDYTAEWDKECVPFRHKIALIREVARIARTLHNNGINHRDFYICHFLLDWDAYQENKIKLYLIDLHRAQIRRKIPKRWRIKDLAGLFFSSKDIGLTQRDLLRFIKEYEAQPLKFILRKKANLWKKIEYVGNKLYEKEQHERNHTSS